MAKELKQYDEFYGLDDLISESFGIPLADEDITVWRLAQAGGCTHETAKRRIKEGQSAEKIVYIGKRRAKSGKLLDAWRVRQNDPPQRVA